MLDNSYKNKIEDILTQSISNQIVLSYLSLLQDSCDFSNGEIGKDFTIENNDIIQVTNFVIDSVVNLESLLNLDEIDKQKIISQINSYKKIIASEYEIHYNYLNQYNILLFFMEDMLSKKYLQNNSLNNLDFNKFINDCHEFIESVDSNSNIILQIMKYIPLNMTNQEYLDYIKQAVLIEINKLSQADICQYIKVLKQNFLPSLADGYNDLFPTIVNDVDKCFKLINESNDNAQELLNNIGNKLNSISQYFNLLYKDLNYLIILFSMRFNIDFIYDLNSVYIDLYKTTITVLNKEDENTEFYSETLVTLLDNHIDKIIENQLKITDKLEKLMDKYDDEPELEMLLNTDTAFRLYINTELEDNIYITEDNKQGDKIYIQNNVDEFIKFIESHLNNSKECRIYMQSFLGIILPIWDNHKVVHYIKASMLSSSLDESKLLAINRIGNLMVEYGFIGDN